MEPYVIENGNETDLDRIQPLWEKLNRLHQRVSPYFSHRFDAMTWERRKQSLLAKAQLICVSWVVDTKSKAIVGYCVGTIEKEDPNTGEIDSIYIEEEYRGAGAGTQLVDNTIRWLKLHGAETQKLLVGVGNEHVIDFYKHFGFYPLNVVLQRKEQG
ncbi:MAG: GNAT family N-acetyltransferase [Breznakibacter sp.]